MDQHVRLHWFQKYLDHLCGTTTQWVICKRTWDVFPVYFPLKVKKMVINSVLECLSHRLFMLTHKRWQTLLRIWLISQESTFYLCSRCFTLLPWSLGHVTRTFLHILDGWKLVVREKSKKRCGLEWHFYRCVTDEPC